MPQLNTNTPYPYPDYVDRLDQTIHQYLYQLLKVDQPEPYRSLDAVRNHFHEFLIADIVEGKFVFYTFRPPPVGALNDEFRQVLDNHTPLSKTRIIFFHHDRPLYTNRLYINAICTKFQLDPAFLEAHFAKCESSAFRQWRPHIPIPLPSQQAWLQVYGVSEHFTSVLTQVDDVKTVILFMFQHIPFSTPASETFYQRNLSEAALARLTGDDCRLIEEHPHTIFWHPIQAILRSTTKYAFSSTWSPDEHNYTSQERFDQRRVLKAYRLPLIASSDNIQHFLEKQAIETTSLSTWQDIVEDHRKLIMDFERADADLLKQLQASQSMDAILETRRGLQQSETLKKLTIVAFIFIPFNFSCSFFGMNFKQLGTGTLDIGYFFLGVFLAGVFVFILTTLIVSFSKAATKAKENVLNRGWDLQAWKHYECPCVNVKSVPIRMASQKPTIDDISLTAVIWNWSLRRSLRTRRLIKFWQRVEHKLAEELAMKLGRPVNINEISKRQITRRVLKMAWTRITNVGRTTT